MPIWGEVELLCRAVYEEGQSRAEEVLAQAKMEAERIVAEAERKAEKNFQELSLAQKSEASGEARRLIDTAELEARKKIMGFREQVMNELLDGLKERLKSVHERPDYPDFLLATVNEGIDALKGAEFIVEMNSRDLERVKDKIGHLSKERSLKIDLKPSPTIQAGSRVYSGDRRTLYDNTLEARLHRREEDIRRDIWRTIFGSDAGK